MAHKTAEEGDNSACQKTQNTDPVSDYLEPEAVAGIIGALDIFGMVALFVAPRVLEGRFRKQSPAQSPSEDSL
ncbi:hypothetical protein [Oceanimonas smirnovii]|uniref:hypothetical protein n=1 Tax=Oceanimonas smirnovii TaxID=264574 RepID=UPI003FD34F44